MPMKTGYKVVEFAGAIYDVDVRHKFITRGDDGTVYAFPVKPKYSKKSGWSIGHYQGDLEICGEILIARTYTGEVYKEI